MISYPIPLSYPIPEQIFGLPINAEELLTDMNTDKSGLVDYEQFKAMMLITDVPGENGEATPNGSRAQYRGSAARKGSASAQGGNQVSKHGIRVKHSRFDILYVSIRKKLGAIEQSLIS